MGKLEGDFFLPGHPQNMMALGETGAIQIYPFQPIGYAVRATGSAGTGKWDRESGRRLTAGAKKFLQRFAAEEALRHKKTPTGIGAEKLDKYFIRKSENVNPPRRIFLKNLSAVLLRQGVRVPMPRFSPGRVAADGA